MGAIQRYMYTSEYIPVDGNFEDGTAILREIGQDSDSPDSDFGSEMELESQHVRASLVPSHSASWPEGDFKILF